jgi:hypothetical protein
MKWEPKVGDPCVELWKRSHGTPYVSAMTTVHRLTSTLVVTADGEKYNRQGLYPIKGGRYSSKSLRSAHDPEVLAARAHDHLLGVARLAENLSLLDRRTAEDYVGALAQIIAKADESRRAVVDLMREATAGGES